MARNVLVTGAGGYVGSALARRLACDKVPDGSTLTLLDLVLPSAPAGARALVGDFADPEVRARALDPFPDVVFHLGGVLGGAAEANYALARRVNVDATLALLEALRRPGNPPRVIFASTIAVFGVPMPALVTDATLPLPSLTYGAQKLMIETIINQFSARGWIEGLSPRFPGIVARPDADARLKSAFLNTMFHDFAAGRSFRLPVSPAATTWLLSLPALVDNLMRATVLDAADLPPQRAFVLPAQRVTIEAVLEGLAELFPASASEVSFAPDDALTAQFGNFPELETRIADTLGFRHDGDISTLVRNALAHP